MSHCRCSHIRLGKCRSSSVMALMAQLHIGTGGRKAPRLCMDPHNEHRCKPSERSNRCLVYIQAGARGGSLRMDFQSCQLGICTLACDFAGGIQLEMSKDSRKHKDQYIVSFRIAYPMDSRCCCDTQLHDTVHKDFRGSHCGICILLGCQPHSTRHSRRMDH